MSEEYVNLSDLTTKELRAVAKDLGVSYKFKDTKARLIEAIEEYLQENKDEVETEEVVEEVIVETPLEEELPPMSVRQRRIYEANKGG